MADAPSPDRAISSGVGAYSTRPLLQVDLGAIARNYAVIQSKVGHARIGASVKANAYGLGLEPVAKTLYGVGCRTFFVALAGEGMQLREAIGDNASIYVLNGPGPRDVSLFFKHKLRPVLNSPEQVQTWSEAAGIAKHAPYSAIMIDTGMNRLGLSLADVKKLSKTPKVFETIGLDHIMSHLACSDNPENPKNAEQLQTFNTALSMLPKKTTSLSASGGVFLGARYHFDMVRPGISLFGGAATVTPDKEGTEPVATLLGTVLQFQYVKKGETVGYDASFTAPRDMRIATVGAGYADGVPVQLSGTNERPGGKVRIGRKEVRILGRVSMDLTTLDVTDAKPRIGDNAAFFGPLLHDSAVRAGTIDYDILTGLGARCRIDYQRGGTSEGAAGGRTKPPRRRGAPGGRGSAPRGTAASATRSPRSREKTSRSPTGRRPRS